jgi:cytochrome c peroxidase
MRAVHVLRIIALPVLLASAGATFGLTPQEQLGKSIFFDDNLSLNGNQACAACHAPEWGWTGPNTGINSAGAVYEGSIAGRFGNRKPPSSAYATPSPILHFEVEDDESPLFVGGNFWDGRATGEKLGNPAADQAQGPFLNPLEQALPDSACVVHRVCTAAYPVTFATVFPGACPTFPANANESCAAGQAIALVPAERVKSNAAYDSIALAIAAFEGSSESNAYTSKYDAYLAGDYKLSKQERQGLNLFAGKGKCAACHVLERAKGKGEDRSLFTDFTFDNLGVPRNPANPFYLQGAFNPAGGAWVDMGLGDFLATRADYKDYAPDNYGKQKVPTLRNVDLRPAPGEVKAFAHNGYFKTLKQIVHFYNTRDVKPSCADDPSTVAVDESIFLPVEAAMVQGCWPEPEVTVNVNRSELGDLKLTDEQEDAIVAFMQALSDGYTTP